MKSLAEGGAADRMRRRLRSLCETDQRQWGVMSVAEMVCHLRESFPMATGARPTAPVHGGWRARAMKFLALRVPVQWPKDVATVPELQVGAARMRLASFAEDKASAIAAFERFLVVANNRTSHSFFGAMEPADWMRWGYLHTDHHLRQFGR